MDYDVVVSYAREDREIAVTLCNQLVAEGVQARIAPRVTSLDNDFAMEIVGMISTANFLVAVVSAYSNSSGQMIREIELATKNGLEILPVRLDDTKLKGALGYYLSDKHWFSMNRKEVEPWKTAQKISQYLGDRIGEEEIAVEKVQATIEELKNKPEMEAMKYKRKTYSAILAMLAIPLFIILMIWMILSRFDFNENPSDQELEAARQHVIELQDSTLELAVLETLSDKGYVVEGDLTEADMWELTSLKVVSPDEKKRIDEALLTEANRRIAENGLIEIDGVIENLDGLEFAKNLEELIIAGQSIQRVDPLANLTELHFLDLSSNRISDIASLENLATIRVLILDNNAIRDIGAIGSLVQVSELNLANNEIIDITSLENMTELKNLNLRNNKIHNIRSVGNLAALEAINVSGNQINEIGGLSNLDKLTWLKAEDNHIDAINALSSLKELKWLYVGENAIRDISVIKEFEHLIGLGVEHNDIQNVDVLEEATEAFQMLSIDQATYNANLDVMEALEERNVSIQVIQ